MHHSLFEVILASMKKDLQAAKALVPGDSIGILATGAPLSRERFELGMQAIESRGYKTVVPLDPSRDFNSLSNAWSNGSARERVDVLEELVEDSSVKAIITARGGYGTSHMIPHLRPELFAENPKPIVGLSDATPLLCYLAFHCGVFSIHGSPLGASIADSKDGDSALKDTEELLSILSDDSIRPSYSCEVLRAGSAKGRIVAGNLSMLAGMIATPWDIDYSDTILVIEDVAESPFRIHRMLSHLAFSGKLYGLAGLVFGRFSKCESKNGPSIEDVFSMVLDDIFKPSAFPVYSNLEMGHWGRNVPLPLGCMAEMSNGVLSLLESPVRD